MNVTSGGNPVTILGIEVKVGDHAKEFKLVKNDFSVASLKDYGDKIKVLNIVPSLDTGICDAQARRFNAEFKDREDVVVITISNDLPFAQARWCGSAGLPNAITLSAHKDEVFAKDYGVLVKELRLLSRSVIVLDKENKVTLTNYVLKMSSHPNYELVINHLK